MATRLQLRRGSTSEWVAINPVLASGEPGFEINTGKLKVGDGTSNWTSLGYINAGDESFIVKVTVADEEGRFALTTNDVQNGDYVRQTDSGLLYVVTDQNQLDSELGYTNLATVDWTHITGRPSTFLPVIGGGADQAVAGNDPRLTDARTPTEHTHVKADVGLGNVDNTSDVDKPVSSATQTALNLKQDSLGYTAEDQANKRSSFQTTPTNTAYPTEKLVKDALDAKAEVEHTHPKSDVVNLQDDLDGLSFKAELEALKVSVSSGLDGGYSHQSHGTIADGGSTDEFDLVVDGGDAYQEFREGWIEVLPYPTSPTDFSMLPNASAPVDLRYKSYGTNYVAIIQPGWTSWKIMSYIFDDFDNQPVDGGN
jgi:hypothetical protein